MVSVILNAATSNPQDGLLSITNNKNCNPIHLAAKLGDRNIDILTLLLKYWKQQYEASKAADAWKEEVTINAKANKGVTPFMIAIKRGILIT